MKRITSLLLTLAAVLMTCLAASVRAQCNFTVSPTGGTFCPGDTVTLNAAVVLASSPITWRRNGTVVGTGNQLVISPVGEANQGTYVAEATGVFGGLCTSAPATVIVRNLPTITGSPQDVSNCIGATAVFSCSATGDNLSFRWQRNSTDLADGPGISGSGTNVLTLTNIDSNDNGTYRCVASGPCPGSVGNVQVTQPAQLIVRVPAVIQADPGNVNRCLGANASLSVTVNANASPAPGYQWRKGTTTLTNGGRFSGVNTATLNITGLLAADNGSDYNCVLTHPCGNSISNNGAINVDVPVTVSTIGISNPSPICTNTTTTLTVFPAGSPPYTYVWRRNGGVLNNGTIVSGQGTNTLTLTNPTTGFTGTYSCLVSNACATNVPSPNLPVTVQAAPVITAQPPATTPACAGSVATISISATGATSYRWRKDTTDLMDGGTISGATTPTLTITGVAAGDAGSYDCVVGNGCTVTSTASNLLLPIPVSITGNPASVQRNPPGLVSFTTVAAGDNLVYQWRRNGVNLVNGGRYSGVNSAMLTITSTQTSDYADVFDCVVTGPCSAATSGKASMWQCDLSEFEPNDNKVGANVIAMVPGQTICGSTTGSAGTGAASLDYFRINLPQLPGLTRYELALVSASGHVLTLRGLGQSNGLITVNSDITLFTATNLIFGRPTLVWYGSGTSAPSVFVSVAGTASATTPYSLQLSATSITPEELTGGALSRGPVGMISTGGDTELWVYDANLNPIVNFGNDDFNSQSAARLTRTYEGGTYYLALGFWNLANNLPSPSDDAFRSGNVTDFPGVTIGNSASLAALGVSINGRPVPPAAAGVFGIRWIKFTVSCNAADIAGLGGALGPDGQLTADDLVAYLAAFFAPNVAVADIVGLGGAPNPPDGQITADDLVYFLSQYFAGCN